MRLLSGRSPVIPTHSRYVPQLFWGLNEDRNTEYRYTSAASYAVPPIPTRDLSPQPSGLAHLRSRGWGQGREWILLAAAASQLRDSQWHRFPLLLQFVPVHASSSDLSGQTTQAAWLGPALWSGLCQ